MINMNSSGAAAVTDAITLLRVVELATDPAAARKALEELQAARKAIDAAKAEFEQAQRDAQAKVDLLPDLERKAQEAERAAKAASERAEQDVAAAKIVIEKAKAAEAALEQRAQEIAAAQVKIDAERLALAKAREDQEQHFAHLREEVASLETKEAELRANVELFETRVATARAEIAKLLGNV